MRLYSIISASLLCGCKSLVTNGIKRRHDSPTLFATFKDDQQFDARTCPKNLLTQRSIQSFAFLLKQIGDPHTVKWIEDFLECKGTLLSYHGLGAFDLKRFSQWDCVLTELLDAPSDIVVVQIQKRKSTRSINSFVNSLSGNNSVQKYTPPTPRTPQPIKLGRNGDDYLSSISAKSSTPTPSASTEKLKEGLNINRRNKSQRRRHSSKKKKKHSSSHKEEVFLPKGTHPSEEDDIRIEIDIDPRSIISRILSVRQKIADEWSSDLDLLVSVNGKILESYSDRNKNERKDENKKKNMNDVESFDRKDFEPLAFDVNKVSGDFGQRTVQKFDRYTVYLLNNHPSFNDMYSSPLRASNFDLLLLLSTQESIHRVLKNYKNSGENKEVSFIWLKDFYTKKLPHYFDGDQSFGRADDFMDELLGAPPVLKNLPGGKMGFIDPLAIAGDVINQRELVAREWKSLMSNVSNDHEVIRKNIWIRQMQKWGQPIHNSLNVAKESTVEAFGVDDFE